MLLKFFNRVFNTVAYQKKLNAERLEYLQAIKDDMYSPSKGIVSTSQSLYNFLKCEHEPFSLKEFSDMTGVTMTTYSPNSGELLELMRQIQSYRSQQYLNTIKSIPEYMEFNPRLFGDWYDSDDSINQAIGMMEDVIETFLYYLKDDYIGQQEDDGKFFGVALEKHQLKVDMMEKMNRRYPGLYDFVQMKDYYNLMTEILNILMALYTINLRSLGETSQ